MNNKKNNRATLKIIDSSKMQFVNFQDINIKNHGASNLKEIKMNDSGYINEKSGVTNIDGILTTDGKIRNKGVFNINKKGNVKIFLKKLEENIWNFLKKPEFWITFIISITGIVLAIYYANK